MKFNINNTVRVKLTERGRQLITQNHKALLGKTLAKEYPRIIKETDGWSDWALWSLMTEFGQHIHMGGPLLFETEIEIPEKEKQ